MHREDTFEQLEYAKVVLQQYEALDDKHSPGGPHWRFRHPRRQVT